MSPAPARRARVGLLGAGAIGSRAARLLCDDAVDLLVADAQRVEIDNLGVSAFDVGDVGKAKAAVIAASHRAAGGAAWALVGDVARTVGPGLIAALDVVVLALDNPRALETAARVAWSGARPGTPVVALTCGGEARPGHLVRVYGVPGPCVACDLTAGERRQAEVDLGGAPCRAGVDDGAAPRAAAEAAEAAARAGVDLLRRLVAGEPGLVGRRYQRETPDAEAFEARLAPTPSRHCRVAHAPEAPVRMLAGTSRTTLLADLAASARRAAGDDAIIVLGSRGPALHGFVCSACGARWPVPPLLLPAARTLPRQCRCDARAMPLGICTTVAASELARHDDAARTLADWGMAPGDELLVTGVRGHVRLRCRLDWEELA